MKNFELTPKMLSMGGGFYPTGHAFIMFPDAQDAEKVARRLDREMPHKPGEEVMLLTPDVIVRQIGRVDGHSHMRLPSVGTEGATVHKYVDLAREGHYAILVPAHSDKETERVMDIVREVPFSYAQRYHILAIEDLE